MLSGQPSFGALLRLHFVVSISKDFCHFLANSTPAHREHICINFLIQCIAKFISVISLPHCWNMNSDCGSILSSVLQYL